MSFFKNTSQEFRARAAILIVFFFFFIIEYLTPVHSDDFFYGQIGIGFAKHWYHYTHWSGRLLADYASALILMLPNHVLVSMAIAFFATATMALIVAIPTRLIDTRFTAYKMFAVTAFYWVCNTNLGQTTFWVVGASNYLVTNFFIALFLFVFLSWRKSDSTIKRVLLLLLALLAGCSNENTSLALIYTFIVLCVLMRFLHIDFNIKTAILCVVGIIVGTLVLLLAPGNFVRASNPSFQWFRDTGIFGKILKWLQRAGRLFHFTAVYILVGVGCWKLYHTMQEGDRRARLLWSLLFLTSSFASFVVMIASPSMSPRAYNGIFFFLLISLSFAMDIPWSDGRAGKLINLVSIGTMVFFLWSWTLMYSSYGFAKIQDSIRVDHINYEKCIKGSSAEVVVPDYYFARLFKKREKFDLYHSESMAGWFGIAKTSPQKQIDFDYSVIRTGTQISVAFSEGLMNPKVLMRLPSWRTNGNGTIIVETSTDIRGKTLILECYSSQTRKSTEISLGSEILYLSGKYYAGATVKDLQPIANVRIYLR